MKTLTIKDLVHTEELLRAEMAAVRGGYSVGSLPYLFPEYLPSGDASIHATQGLQQFQSVTNATANGSAFLDNLHVTNKTRQFGQNNIIVGGGAPVEVA